MVVLLPELQNLSPNERDEQVARVVGGPRLVLAVRAVAAKGDDWKNFVLKHSSDLATLPGDQVSDVMHYLGAPQNSVYLPSDKFGGDFDGIVEPATALITLVLRVQVVFAEGLRFGPTPPGAPGWEAETRAGKQAFLVDLEKRVEASFSGKGRVSARPPASALPTFATRLEVQIVDDNPHVVFTVDPGAPHDRMGARPPGGGPRQGHLSPMSTEPESKTGSTPDPTGSRAISVTTTQLPAAHEVGHALGLSHIGNKTFPYGRTPTERSDMMGAGDQMQVVRTKGRITHDDFVPFEKIAEMWTRQVLPGPAGRRYTWTAQ